MAAHPNDDDMVSIATTITITITTPTAASPLTLLLGQTRALHHHHCGASAREKKLFIFGQRAIISSLIIISSQKHLEALHDARRVVFDAPSGARAALRVGRDVLRVGDKGVTKAV